MPKLKDRPQDSTIKQLCSNIRYYSALNNITPERRCVIMRYCDKTDRQRLGTATGKTQGDGNFTVEQLANFAAACKIPLYNLFVPLVPEERKAV